MGVIIYQALTRLWGKGLFSSWDKKSLSYIKSLGVDYIWYTGIARHASGKEFVKGAPGCPYSISDWLDTNPYFVSKAGNRISGFESLVRRTHSAGLKVMVDYIPNHVARDYQGDIEHFDYCDYDWTDTLKVNWSSEKTFEAMLEVLRFWAAKGVDGFRCDMVELVDASRLSLLISSIKAEYPHLLFVAEVYQKDNYERYLAAGFDLLYDKSGLYDILVALENGRGSAREITYNWQRLAASQTRMLNFLENHDEQRLAAGSFAALAASLLFNNAAFMIYFGQEVGEDAAESDNRRTSIFSWTKPKMISELYEALHSAVGTELTKLDEKQRLVLARYKEMLGYAKLPAFDGGKNWDLCYCNIGSCGFDPDRHFAFLRYDDGEAYLVVCNFSEQNASIRLRLPEELRSVVSEEQVCVEVGAKDALIVKV